MEDKRMKTIIQKLKKFDYQIMGVDKERIKGRAKGERREKDNREKDSGRRYRIWTENIVGNKNVHERERKVEN